MTEWLISIEGTHTGHRLALALALMAAFLHAVFGALQKGRHDPWLARGAIDASYGLMAAPFALFVVPWPEPHMWAIFGVVWVIHVAYKCLQAWAYTKGSYTVVYPVVRGTGPLLTVVGAYILFAETFSLVQWIGVVTLMAGIFGLAAYNLRYLETERDTLHLALGLAVLTGAFVALYTTYDAYGIRATADHFSGVVFHDRRDRDAADCLCALATHGASACCGAFDAAGNCRRCCGFPQLWIDHAGNPPRQGGRSCGIARNIDRLCRHYRLAGA